MIAVSLGSMCRGMGTSLARRVVPGSVLVRREKAGRVAPRHCLLRGKGTTSYVSMTVVTRKCARGRVSVFCGSTRATYSTLFDRRPFGGLGSGFGVITITDPSRSDKIDVPKRNG